MSNLPIPDFFDPTLADSVWRVEYQQRALDALHWKKTHGITNSANDRLRIALVPIDMQNSFCIPGFELFVAGRSGRGAIDDSVRLAQFIYRNLGIITKIFPTMDTHTIMQIFHAIMWVDDEGNHPTPGTMPSEDDVRSGKWRINPAVAAALDQDYMEFQRYAQHYTASLASKDKIPLTIWPYHVMITGIGHAMVSLVEEAIYFHAFARNSEIGVEIKGGNPLTENYSVLRPEVLEDHRGRPFAQKNTRFISTLLNFDRVIIPGQAKGHCVAWTIQDLLGEILEQDESLVKKVYLMEDCTSAVVIPGVFDSTDDANEAFDRFRDAGMHVVKSTDPIETWPDFVI